LHLRPMGLEEAVHLHVCAKEYMRVACLWLICAVVCVTVLLQCLCVPSAITFSPKCNDRNV
jgi:hypothetical protein